MKNLLCRTKNTRWPKYVPLGFKVKRKTWQAHFPCLHPRHIQALSACHDVKDKLYWRNKLLERKTIRLSNTELSSGFIQNIWTHTFSRAACQCSHVGNNCDTNTGQCICPPNTIGERCDHCAPNHWGHDITTGCKVGRQLDFERAIWVT